jgi:hypothetical protein
LPAYKKLKVTLPLGGEIPQAEKPEPDPNAPTDTIAELSAKM